MWQSNAISGAFLVPWEKELATEATGGAVRTVPDATGGPRRVQWRRATMRFIFFGRVLDWEAEERAWLDFTRKKVYQWEDVIKPYASNIRRVKQDSLRSLLSIRK